LLIAVAAASLLVMGSAGDGRAADMAARGNELWKLRDSPERTLQAIEAWEKALKSRPRDVELMVKIARAYHWRSEPVPRSEKKLIIQYCKEGLVFADRALEIDPEHIGANHWHMVLQGEMTENRGILSGFNFGSAIQKTMIIARQDDAYYHGSIYRYWGKVLYYIPGIVGRFFKFTLEDSAALCKRAVEISPNFFENHQYLAETYLKMGEDEKARKELEWIVSKDPALLPDYAPENRLSRRRAQKLLEKHFKTF